MNRQIAKLGAALLVCYLVLFAQLNRTTVFGAQRLKDNPANTREILRDYDGPRGSIATADGVVIARSVDAADGSQFERTRTYPEGDLFAHVVGYYSLNLGSTGVEDTYNAELVGRTLDLSFRDLNDLFVERDRVGDLTLSLRADVQRVAREALGDRRGSVVAIDPRTGEILTMWSFPSFDPNAVADQDFAAANDVFTVLNADSAKPLLAKTYRERYFPGSTFKIVTATAGLESGEVTRDEPSYPVTNEYIAPQTSRPLRNFGGSTCGGDLFEVLRVSCNTAFAQMAIDLGADTMIDTAEDFGFNAEPPIDLPGAAVSNYPTDFDQNLPALAQTGIGQNDVAATPLQMALVAGAVANEGIVMNPRVLDTVRDDEGTVVEDPEPSEWRRAMGADTAAIMREAMINVAQNGTARNLLIPGFEVGGKTGTAQLGTDPPRSHAWIVGFAGPPGGAPSVAVAVIVEGQEGASEQTGGRVAAPIARAVMETILAAQGSS
ncbi:peptidoglycan D,D-transpeptidase FtsI family protein [Actinospongicola halichondriae]|uniref:peptidoglycan D,D-transpeptidase FtsI family protein n=1 Tax=Actinospongicola halichondriae TaxID=3236844 RepID=UPI003D4FADC8